jgi:hypothetical protein
VHLSCSTFERAKMHVCSEVVVGVESDHINLVRFGDNPDVKEYDQYIKTLWRDIEDGPGWKALDQKIIAFERRYNVHAMLFFSSLPGRPQRPRSFKGPITSLWKSGVDGFCKRTGNAPKTRPLMRWVHIPCNNMAWVTKTVRILASDEGAPFRNIFDHHNWMEKLHKSYNNLPHATFFNPATRHLNAGQRPKVTTPGVAPAPNIGSHIVFVSIILYLRVASYRISFHISTGTHLPAF